MMPFQIHWSVLVHLLNFREKLQTIQTLLFGPFSVEILERRFLAIYLFTPRCMWVFYMIMFILWFKYCFFKLRMCRFRRLTLFKDGKFRRPINIPLQSLYLGLIEYVAVCLGAPLRRCFPPPSSLKELNQALFKNCSIPLTTAQNIHRSIARRIKIDWCQRWTNLLNNKISFNNAFLLF